MYAELQSFPYIQLIPEAVDKFRLGIGIGDTLWLWIVYFVVCGVLAMVVSGFVAYTVLFERKIAGYIQERPGPNRVGPWGLFQPVADVMKLMIKEDIIHDGADKFMFRLAPYIVFLGPFMALAVLPLAMNIQFWPYASGLLYVFAFGGFSVLGILVGGYASNNKFSLIGGMRGASQLIAYEVPFFTTVLAAVLIVGSFNLGDIVNWQKDGLWLAAVQPVGFILFIICMTAETNRTPFDIPEGESEITGGFHTEYSGIRFGIFFLGEYTALLVMSIFGTVLYLGGSNGPPALKAITENPLSFTNIFWLLVILVLFVAGVKSFLLYLKTREYLLLSLFSFAGIGLIVLHLAGSHFGITFLHLPVIWFVIKVCFLIFVAMMFRWTYLRMRIDHLTSFAWKFMVPVALANLIITCIVVLLLQGRAS